MRDPRRAVRAIVLAIVVAAIAVPVAHGTYDSWATSNARPAVVAPAPTIVLAPSTAANGFDWGDAAIGAGVVAGAIALLAAAGGAVVRRRHKEVLPEKSGMAPV
jgi:hypothetical protein